MQEVLYDLNILNGLFTEKDFDFLKKSNLKEQTADMKLTIAAANRDKIVNYINNFDSIVVSNNIASTQANIYINNAQKAFNNINETIKNLCTVQSKLKDIEKEILELIVKKENNQDNSDLSYSISKIREDINSFDRFSKDVEKKNFVNNILIEKFFRDVYDETTKNYSGNNNLNIRTPETAEVKKEFNIPQENNTFNNISNSASNINTTSSNIYKEHAIDHKSKVNTHNDNFEIKDNFVLRISEKDKKVYLPYSKNEILEFLDAYPDVYPNFKSLLNQEYIVDLNFYIKHPVLARFRETYSLIRDREMKSVVDAFKKSIDLMFKYELNPAIIAGLKSENQLDMFLDCLDKNKLEEFKPFKIIFEVNPI